MSDQCGVELGPKPAVQIQMVSWDDTNLEYMRSCSIVGLCDAAVFSLSLYWDHACYS